MDDILKFFASLDLIDFLGMIAGILIIYAIAMWFLMGKKKRESLVNKVKGNKSQTSSKGKKRSRYDELDDLVLDNLNSIPSGNPVVQTPRINESYKAVVIEDEDSVTIRAGSNPQPDLNPKPETPPTLPTKQPQSVPNQPVMPTNNKLESAYKINLMDEIEQEDAVQLSSGGQSPVQPQKVEEPIVQKPIQQPEVKKPIPAPVQSATPTYNPAVTTEFNALNLEQLALIEDEEEMNRQVIEMMESMNNEVRRLRQEVEKMREQQTDLRTEFTKLKELQASQAPHTQAIMLAKQGLSVQDIVERCGISLSEAELIMSLYHK